MDNPNELLAPSGSVVEYKKWAEGDKIQGVFVTAPRVLPHMKFGTQEQETSKKGNKLWKFKLVIENEDGVHTLYPEKDAYFKTLQAFKKAGLRDFADAIGGTYALKKLADKPSETPGFAPAKQFQAAFKPAQD